MRKRALNFREFVLASQDDTMIVSFTTIQRDYAKYLKDIVKADRQGKTYIQVDGLPCGTVEIQWSWC